MKKTLLFLLVAFFTQSLSFAQEATPSPADSSNWKINGAGNLSFANVALSNWAGGGESSISLGFIGKLIAERKTEKSLWQNELELAVGGTRVGDANLNRFKKTDDQLIFNSRYGYNISKKWSFAANLNFRTQLLPGYTFYRDSLEQEQREQRISGFLAPGYLATSLGVQYIEGGFQLMFSPVTSKMTMVLDDSLSSAGAFGVGPGKKLRTEIGAGLAMEWKTKVMKNVQFTTRGNLFMNYETPDLIDVNWETLLIFKVNKYITTSFGTQLIYDHDVIIEGQRRIQFKQVLNLNVGTTFEF